MVVKKKVEDHNNHIETFFDPFFAKTVPAKNLQQEMCQVPPRDCPHVHVVWTMPCCCSIKMHHFSIGTIYLATMILPNGAKRLPSEFHKFGILWESIWFGSARSPAEYWSISLQGSLKWWVLNLLYSLEVSTVLFWQFRGQGLMGTMFRKSTENESGWAHDWVKGWTCRGKNSFHIARRNIF